MAQRKETIATMEMWGIEDTEVRYVEGGVWYLRIRTAKGYVDFVAGDEDLAREIIAQLRRACTQWERHLDPSAVPHV